MQMASVASTTIVASASQATSTADSEHGARSPKVREIDSDRQGLLLTLNVINSMEQGVLVWSTAGRCEMHNDRIFEVLELRHDDMCVGTTRLEFLALSVKRGEISEETAAATEELFRQSSAFNFDRNLPSGRVVATMARPLASGGFVVTFTDVTASRQSETELAKAIQVAEEAERKANRALEAEQGLQGETQMLSELDEWLQSCKSLNELFTVVNTFMCRLLPRTTGILYIYSNSRDVLDSVCHWNHEPVLDHIQPDSCWALRRGRSYRFSNEK